MAWRHKLDSSRLLATFAVYLAISCTAAGPSVAQESQPDSGTPSSLEDAVERLQQIVEELRPKVEALESRDAPPTADEMERARPHVDRLDAAIGEVEELLQTTGTTDTPAALRAARKLLRRIAALDLTRRAAELRAMVDEMAMREERPGDDEIAEVRRLAYALQASMDEFESESSAVQPSKKSVREAEKAVALSRSADVMAEAEESTSMLEEAESDPTEVTEEDAREARQAAGELQSSIDAVKRNAGIKKGEDEPPGLKRARKIVIRLQILDLAGATTALMPEIERLEGLPEPPSTAELDALRPLIARLTNALEALGENLEIEDVEEYPPEVVAGLDAHHRFARLDLERSLTDLRPLVDAAAQQEEPLSPQQVTELRGVPKIIRPKLTEARRSQKKDPLIEEGSASPEVVEANRLLEQVQNLVPDSEAVNEEPVDAPSTQPVTRFFRFYGSLRVRALMTPGTNFEIDGQTSRVGVRLESPDWLKKVRGFARAELGFNFIEATGEVFKSVDEGRGGVTDSLFFKRLLFVGADIHDNRISFGKQWSAFYDVGVFSDQMPFFAGEGTGVYAAGSDGGVSGTGRADNALQYRDAVGVFKYTAQIQIRNETDNNKPLADTVGGSVTWKTNDRMQVGVAFNVVRDGVPDPADEKPREGDRALIVGHRYQEEEYYAGATVTLFNNHDRDNLGTYFSGLGFEWYGGYQWSERLLLRLAISSLNPDSDYEGSYRILSFVSGASYDFTEKIRLLLLTRYDRSKLADASDRNRDVVSLSVFYNF